MKTPKRDFCEKNTGSRKSDRRRARAPFKRPKAKGALSAPKICEGFSVLHGSSKQKARPSFLTITNAFLKQPARGAFSSPQQRAHTRIPFHPQALPAVAAIGAQRGAAAAAVAAFPLFILQQIQSASLPFAYRIQEKDAHSRRVYTRRAAIPSCFSTCRLRSAGRKARHARRIRSCSAAMRPSAPDA